MVTGKTTPTRVPTDALRDLTAHADKRSEIWRDSEEMDLATLLSSVATPKEVASDDSLLYQPECKFVTLTQF